MKLYRIASPGSAPDLVKFEAETEKPMVEITIGEYGRGRKEGIIPIIGEEGPEVRAKKTDEGVVLVRGDWSDEGRCLAVINTVGEYDRTRTYGVLNSNGVEAIAAGTIAFGAAGATNNGQEILAIVESGATFRLNSKYASHWYRWDGTGWTMETPEERKARFSLAEVEQGGGEWL